jgi:hypothetical protein
VHRGGGLRGGGVDGEALHREACELVARCEARLKLNKGPRRATGGRWAARRGERAWQ